MNKLYLGDNLAILENIPDNSVDLIATDPPFNTGKDWGAFDDRWDGGLKGYLKFMEQRCIEMHRVLKDTGSFYLHCNQRVSHYLKVMLDSIFSIDNFRNEIIWHFKKPPSYGRKFEQHHNTIFGYSKTEEWTWNKQYQPKSQETIKRNGLRKRKITGRTPEGKRLQEAIGEISDKVPCGDVWYSPNISSMGKQRTGYPTQKPLALYQRIIKASSNEGNTVLDPFAGSGTTLDAAQSLNRKWIGIDQNPDAIALIEKRMIDRHALFMRKGVDYQLKTK